MKNKKRKKLEILKRFLEPYWKRPKTTLKSFAFFSMWGVGPIIHIYFIQKITHSIEIKNEDLFFKFLFLYIGTYFTLVFSTFIIRTWGVISNIAFFREVIHNYYLNKFVKLSNTETEKIGTGKIISIIGTGMDTWVIMLNKTLEKSIRLIFAIVFTIYMISEISILFAFIFTFLYIGIHFVGGYFNKKSLIHRRKRQDSWNNYNGLLVKIMMSKFEILQTGKVNTELKKVNKNNTEQLKHSLNMATPTFLFYYTPSVFINIIKFLTFGFVGYQVIQGNYSMSFFVGLFGVLTLMNQTIVNSMTFFSELTANFTKIEKMWDFFDNTDDIKGYEEGKDFKYKTGDIKLEKINFGYNEKNKNFTDFELNIKGGKITALVGNSGSGKSTLVKLISGYIRADSGKVLVDGQDLEKINLKSFYKNIGYLTQEPSVFDGSILDNLMYGVTNNKSPIIPFHKGDEDKSRDVWQKHLNSAIKKAKCEFIYDLEDGINTEIGEKGVRLSGGQRQRLAIAKIFLKDPKIIILDEPTSALDSFSEEQITKSLNNLFEGRTVIIIAHRLQTVKNADNIIVLENGKIKEEGTHKKLVEKGGIYKKMLDLQSGF